MKSQTAVGVRLWALTQLPDEGHEFLVLAQRQDGALVRRYGRREAEELPEKEALVAKISQAARQRFDVHRYLLTVRCSSPSLTWNVCSKMVYMILPMPKDGSMTLGMTSSTAGDKQGGVRTESDPNFA